MVIISNKAMQLAENVGYGFAIDHLACMTLRSGSVFLRHVQLSQHCTDHNGNSLQHGRSPLSVYSSPTI